MFAVVYRGLGRGIRSTLFADLHRLPVRICILYGYFPVIKRPKISKNWHGVGCLESPGVERLPEAEMALYPFWWPDSRFVGYYAYLSETRVEIRKIDATGGPPVTLCHFRGRTRREEVPGARMASFCSF